MGTCVGMAAPDTIYALLQKHDGFADEPVGAISYDTFDDVLEPGEIPTPPLGSSQVLVEMSLASINPSDLHFLRGEYGQPRRRGKPAGFEGVGIVVAAGDDPTALRLIGERVGFVVSSNGSGTWATHAVTDAARCIPIPESVNDYDASGFVVNPLTAAAMFEQARSAGSPGIVLTAGASQVSKFIIALARDAGMATIVIVRRDVHDEVLRKLGATVILNQSHDDFAEHLEAALREHEPQMFIDPVVDSTSSTIFDAMGRDSTWLIYGSLGTTAPSILNPGKLVFSNKVIRGFWLSPWLANTPPDEKSAVIADVQERFSDGRWSTDVGATVALTDVMSTLAQVLEDPRGKVFIKP